MRLAAARRLLPVFLLLPATACAQPPDPAATPSAPAANARAATPAARSDTSAVAWHPSLEAAIAAASVSGKKVLVDIYAPWCPWCRRLQKEVYPAPAVLALVERYFEPVRLNGEIRDDSVRYLTHRLSSAELAQGLGAQGYPTTAFLGPDGAYLTRLPGFAEAGEFERVLRYIGTDAYKTQAYDAFKAADTAAPASAGSGG